MLLKNYNEIMNPIAKVLADIDPIAFPKEAAKRCEDYAAITKIMWQYVDVEEIKRLEEVTQNIFKDKDETI